MGGSTHAKQKPPTQLKQKAQEEQYRSKLKKKQKKQKKKKKKKKVKRLDKTEGGRLGEWPTTWENNQ